MKNEWREAKRTRRHVVMVMGCVVCEDGVVQQVQVFIVVGWCWIMGWWWLWIQYLMWWLMLLGFFFFGWWWWVGWLLSWRININATDWTCGNVGFHLVKIKNVVCDFGGVVVICGFLLLWVGWWFLFSFVVGGGKKKHKN